MMTVSRTLNAYEQCTVSVATGVMSSGETQTVNLASRTMIDAIHTAVSALILAQAPF